MKKLLILLFVALSCISNMLNAEMYISQNPLTKRGAMSDGVKCFPLGTGGGNVGIYADDSVQTTDAAKSKYKWAPDTAEEKARCNKLIKEIAAIKLWRVAVNPRWPDNKTRPLRFLDSGVLGSSAKVRALIGLECGDRIRIINSRYEWRQFSRNGRLYGVVCE